MALTRFTTGSGTYQRATPLVVSSLGNVSGTTTSAFTVTNAGLSQGSLSGLDTDSMYHVQWATPAGANIVGAVIVSAFITISAGVETLNLYITNTTGVTITFPANVQLNLVQL